MIRFSCKCGHEFNVTDDHAGAMMQCPRCSLLVDAPRAEEIGWLAADGAYAVDETTAVADAVPGQTLAELYRSYSRNKYDEHGFEKDLRPNADHYGRMGDRPDDPSGHSAERIAPRYDPVTGERIVPLALKDETPRPVIALAVEVDPSEIDTVADPVAPVPVMALPVEPIPVGTPVPPAGRARSLGYATGDAARPVTLRTLWVDLLIRPANVTVLVFICCFYAAAYLAKIPLNSFALFLGFPTAVANLLNVPLWLLAAHYGCVVEEAGPDLMDDLPRPLRNLEFGDDLIRPGFRVALAGAICFGPMLAVGGITGMATPPQTAATLLLSAAGSLLFPAVVLTLLTGTTVLNLTPGRVLGVMVECGAQYVLSVLLAGATLGLSAFVLLGPSVLPALARVPSAGLPDRSLFVLVPGLALTAYVTHAFAYHLGFLYRAHHDAFPWLAQRHIPTPRAVAVRAGTQPARPRR